LVSFLAFVLFWFGANLGTAHDQLAAGLAFLALGFLIDGGFGWYRRRQGAA
jgi:hypothetical protein